MSAASESVGCVERSRQSLPYGLDTLIGNELPLLRLAVSTLALWESLSDLSLRRSPSLGWLQGLALPAHRHTLAN